MSFNGWTSIKLGELIESISIKHDFEKDELIFLNTSDVLEGKVLHHNYSEVAKMPGQAKKSIQKGDILFSEIRPKNKRFAYIDFDAKDFVVSTKLMVLRRKSSLIDNKFLYKLLTSDRMLNYLQHIAEGRSGTFPQITFSELKNIDVLLPSIQEQIAIAKTLDDLDEKIETNNKINKKLEEMAQAIFKQWFIDFEFPNEDGKPYKSSGGEMVESELGMIPKGWNSKSLLDIADYLNGLAMQKFRPEDDEKGIPVLKIKELRQGKSDENSDLCSLNIDPKYIIHDGDVIFSWSGSLLVDFWCGGKCGLNQHLFKVTSSKFEKWFYYLWTKYHLDKFTRIAKDKATTMGHIKRADLSNSIVLVPNEVIMNKANLILNPIVEKIIEARIEERKLSQLRDTLLPKLMSGEIRVSLV